CMRSPGGTVRAWPATIFGLFIEKVSCHFVEQLSRKAANEVGTSGEDVVPEVPGVGVDGAGVGGDVFGDGVEVGVTVRDRDASHILDVGKQSVEIRVSGLLDRRLELEECRY